MQPWHEGRRERQLPYQEPGEMLVREGGLRGCVAEENGADDGKADRRAEDDCCLETESARWVRRRQW